MTSEETTPEERLLRSLPALRALIDSLAAPPASEARELLYLDRLVRRYPAAARTSLHLWERPPTDVPIPAGWSPAWDLQGLPLWRRTGRRLCVATGDIDRLRFIGTALDRFDAGLARVGGT